MRSTQRVLEVGDVGTCGFCSVWNGGVGCDGVGSGFGGRGAVGSDELLGEVLGWDGGFVGGAT
jgi:hypothetical protein